MQQNPICPLCKGEADKCDHIPSTSTQRYDCPRCGRFEISNSLCSQMELGEYSEERYILSGLSRRAGEQEKQRMQRENTSHFRPFRIDENTIQDQLASLAVSRNPLDRMNRLLLLVQERTVNFQEGASFDFEMDYPLVFARDGAENFYFARMAETMGLLEGSEGGASPVPPLASA